MTPFTIPHESLTSAVVKGFHATPGPTGTYVSQVDPGWTKAPVNRINATTTVNISDETLQARQELLKAPFPVPHECLASTVGKGHHAAPEPTDTAIPQVALGEEKIPCQQDQHTHKS